MSEQLLEALGREIPTDRLVTDVDVVASLSADDAEWAPVGKAAVALRARTEQEVADAVRICADLRVPVVPRGAGTGLSGGANAVDGCLVLDLSRMTAVKEVDADNLVAVVEPGIVNDDLKAILREQGLWYPPDPASAPWSTIGGNVATNAGGLCCVKYGVTRDYVLGMRAVMGGPAGYGNVVRLGRRTAKGVAGYDLTALMVGSEGTLGVVTEVTLRLRPAPRGVPRTIVGAFTSLVDAGRAVAEVTRRGLTPSALELLDHDTLVAVEDWKHLGLEADAEALLLARVDTPGVAGDDEAQGVVDAFETADPVFAVVSTDDQEAETLFAARRLAYPALERLGPVLTEDVCVPRSSLPTMLATLGEIGDRHGVKIGTIAHAGDGNLHPLLITPVGDDAARAAAQEAFEEIIDAALRLGGTVTGEHGVGLLKMDGLRRELDPLSLAVQHGIKSALDPLNIFNPGKVLTA
ncbi:FAD-binding oxidoreductase [Lapillicoccus jejuensis]|uniref:Glycolate oxidase n=1 Tax=Lapillicoccus jejuensis TaxID=402171 RepID=A0A542DZK2_9MICO|nr:FAD-linked oxidase C-terminal domain-containing protein [Lapillicoccus jejuensis]TQJ08521.1 glycolate oxidase [Lapillicoccus jejuensis]